MEKKLFALRGAVFCTNDPGDMERRTGELYDALLERNNLDEGDIVSLVFSLTADLDAANPAAVLRRSGRAADLALFCVQEAAVQGSPAGVIRSLLHCYLPAAATPRHAYLNGAESLRPDRGSMAG